MNAVELEIALTQAKADIAAGHYTTESVDAHLQKLFEDNKMKDEYNFSNAEQGKFYVPIHEIEIEKQPNVCSSWHKKMTIQPILQVPPDQLVQPLDDVWNILVSTIEKSEQ